MTHNLLVAGSIPAGTTIRMQRDTHIDGYYRCGADVNLAVGNATIKTHQRKQVRQSRPGFRDRGKGAQRITTMSEKGWAFAPDLINITGRSRRLPPTLIPRGRVFASHRT